MGRATDAPWPGSRGRDRSGMTEAGQNQALVPDEGLAPMHNPPVVYQDDVAGMPNDPFLMRQDVGVKGPNDPARDD